MVTPVAWKGSADQRAVGAANCLAFFPPGERTFAAGEHVAIHRLGSRPLLRWPPLMWSGRSHGMQQSDGWTRLWLSSASGLLLWAALPPLGWWPLAWIAPVFWLRLITQDQLRWPPALRGHLVQFGAVLDRRDAGNSVGTLGQLPRTRGARVISGDLRAAVHRGGSACGASLAHPAAVGCTDRLDGHGTAARLRAAWLLDGHVGAHAGAANCASSRWRTCAAPTRSVSGDVGGSGLVTAWSASRATAGGSGPCCMPCRWWCWRSAYGQYRLGQSTATTRRPTGGARGVDSGFDRHDLRGQPGPVRGRCSSNTAI